MSLLNWLELDFAGSFGGAVCVKMFSHDCTVSAYQIGHRWVCSGVFFKPPRSAHFLNDFPLVPPLKNFKKWPILVSLLNWLELDFAGSFGGAVCVKMFSDDCTLSAYQLGDRPICSGVFFKPPRSAHFLNDFPLVPPLKNFKKWPILVSLLTNKLMLKTETNLTTDREQFTRSNAPTARLPTLVRLAETLTRDWLNTNEPREMVMPTITLLYIINWQTTTLTGTLLNA